MTRQSHSHTVFDDLVLPVICAPMFLVSGPDLVLAACKSGVIGVLPSGTARNAEQFVEWLDQLDAGLDQHRKENGSSCPAYACNLSIRKGDRFGTPRFAADLEACRARKVPLIITANGDPSEIVPKIHAWGGLVFHDVTTLRHAEKAIAAGVDGLIVIGNGGGGHAGTVNPFALIPQIRRIFDGYIVMAGTVSTGRAVRAAEVLGADLCYIGTRFIATRESMAPVGYKQMLVEAKTSDIIYTPAFTRGVPANFMKPSIASHGFDPDRLAPLIDRAELPEGIGAWKDIWAAGQGVGLIDDIPTVSELVGRLKREYDEASAESGTRLARRARSPQSA